MIWRKVRKVNLFKLNDRKMKCSIYSVEGEDFGTRVWNLLEKCGMDDGIVRLVFWGNPRDNREYLKQREEIGKMVRARFGKRSPAFSYIAQRPLTADLVVEVHGVDVLFEGEIVYKTFQNVPYVVIRERNYSELIAGGMSGKDVNAPVRKQAEEAMEQMGRILAMEGFAVDGIVRQWNYLERITEFDGDYQRYQAFNEARSVFYAKAIWSNGYPAATGIGMQQGGVVIDFTAVKTEGKDCRNVPLDNTLQIAAHAYSQQVLQGRLSSDSGEITPKFERARVFDSGQERTIYVSGTAAIRGEQSLAGIGVLPQTGITLDNISYLISGENLRKKGITGESELAMVRVYLKYPDDLETVKTYIGERLQELPVIYLQADVCREELLVEVEGIAWIRR